MIDEEPEPVDRRASPLQQVARAHAIAERAEQGLGPTLTDPAVIERLATLLSASGRTAEHLKKTKVRHRSSESE